MGVNLNHIAEHLRDTVYIVTYRIVFILYHSRGGLRNPEAYKSMQSDWNYFIIPVKMVYLRHNSLFINYLYIFNLNRN